jgi:aryl carrier-like protein
LPAPREARVEASAGAVPQTELEKQIAAVWREVLGVEALGVDESFFEVGGSSLLIVKLHTHLKARTGLDIPVVDLFRYPTIAAQAKHASALGAVKPPPPERDAVRGRSRERHEALRQMAAARVQKRRRL